jgi:hypothetical protein
LCCFYFPKRLEYYAERLYNENLEYCIFVFLQAEIKRNLGEAGIEVKTTAESEAAQALAAARLLAEMPKKRTGFDVTPEIQPRVASAPQPGMIRLNEHGRMVDITGKEIQLQQPMPELKANLRAKQKKEPRKPEAAAQVQSATNAPQQIEKQRVVAEVPSAPTPLPDDETAAEAASQFVDNRIRYKPKMRASRAFHFNEKDKYVKMGNQLRMQVSY